MLAVFAVDELSPPLALMDCRPRAADEGRSLPRSACNPTPLEMRSGKWRTWKMVNESRRCWNAVLTSGLSPLIRSVGRYI